jgi:hypothetical protein
MMFLFDQRSSALIGGLLIFAVTGFFVAYLPLFS